MSPLFLSPLSNTIIHHKEIVARNGYRIIAIRLAFYKLAVDRRSAELGVGVCSKGIRERA